MMEKKLILFVKEKDLPLRLKKDFLDRNLYELEIASGYEEGSARLSEKNYNLIICGLKNIEDQLSLFEEAKKRNFWIKTISLIDCPLEDFFDKMREKKLCFNVIGSTAAQGMDELKVTAEKLLSKDIFGVDRYLSARPRSLEIKIRDSGEKTNSIAQAISFFKKFGKDQSRLSAVSDIVDELLMNALYDAPCNESGEFLYAHLDRMEKVVLEEGKAATLKCAHDGRRLIISVSDPFGSLDKDRFMDYIIGRMTKAESQAKIKPGGGGIGVYKILVYLSAFIVNLQPKEKTEIICVIDLAWQMKEFQNRPKSFHIFTSESEVKMADELTVTRQDLEDALMVTFKGTIDERVHLGTIFQTDKRKIRINLKGVNRINSCGVREWVNAIKEIPAEKQLEFTESSLAMVRQFNMIANFGGSGKQVSFMAPYFCSNCNQRFEKLLTVNEHLEKLLNHEAPVFLCSKCGAKLEFDDLEEKYFQFILRQESIL